eukprot:CAMPEP_0185260466 /NCGR_PEP_ID=MMETSP1359-20130426/9056_1 /TAXON_ID=552665 /ORGANISM="Bigelowiella longifila, Strain CCMP242" /LENGTH=102 /DNA_ID=CAMNT_0027846735 /DNA_START=24 /DNA_END=333 /DNA_ORIENTATION=-
MADAEGEAGLTAPEAKAENADMKKDKLVQIEFAPIEELKASTGAAAACNLSTPLGRQCAEFSRRYNASAASRRRHANASSMGKRRIAFAAEAKASVHALTRQ